MERKQNKPPRPLPPWSGSSQESQETLKTPAETKKRQKRAASKSLPSWAIMDLKLSRKTIKDMRKDRKQLNHDLNLKDEV